MAFGSFASRWLQICQVAHALTALAVSPAAHERFAHVHQAVLDGR